MRNDKVIVISRIETFIISLDAEAMTSYMTDYCINLFIQHVARERNSCTKHIQFAPCFIWRNVPVILDNSYSTLNDDTIKML